jgi:hypothetical protein
LNCTTASGGGPFTYSLSATVGPAVILIAVPALGVAGTWLLLLGALALGLWAVAARQRD